VVGIWGDGSGLGLGQREREREREKEKFMRVSEAFLRLTLV
jgi:hypothetical protein